MRIWINPDKMAKLGLDRDRCRQRDSGAEPPESGGRAGSGSGAARHDFQYPVNAGGRLLSPEQFGDIVVRAQPDGSLLRVRDIGRVELGAEDYKSYSALNGKPVVTD